MKDLKLFGVCGAAGYGTGFLTTIIESHSNFLKHHKRELYSNNGLSPMLVTGPAYSPVPEKTIRDRIKNIDSEAETAIKFHAPTLESYLGLLYDYNYKEIPAHEDSIVVKMASGLHFNLQFLDTWKQQRCNIIIAAGTTNISIIEERRKRIMGELYNNTHITKTQHEIVTALTESNYESWLLLDMGKFVFGDQAEYKKLCNFLQLDPDFVSYDTNVKLYHDLVWNQ